MSNQLPDVFVTSSLACRTQNTEQLLAVLLSNSGVHCCAFSSLQRRLYRDVGALIILCEGIFLSSGPRETSDDSFIVVVIK